MLRPARLITLIATAALMLLLGRAEPFIPNGDWDACGREGNYCSADVPCCLGLVCRCAADGDGSYGRCEANNPRHTPPPRTYCRRNSDCPPDRCCVLTSMGFRGAFTHSCEACPPYRVKDFDTALSDYYRHYGSGDPGSRAGRPK